MPVTVLGAGAGPVITRYEVEPAIGVRGAQIVGLMKDLARALGLPYFPLTPTFPWLGPLGAVPLPSRWVIEVGEAITTDELPPGAADDPMVVFDVTDQVRETIQQTLYTLLMQRRGTFF